MSAKLDLGCGETPYEDYVGVDLYCGPVKVDLTVFPWPWDDASIDAVWCSHFIEHLDGQWVQFMDELYRILKPGAQAIITHPSLQSVRAFQDPTHRDFIPAERWMYGNREWREANGLDHPPYPSCDFDFEIGAGFAEGWEIRSHEAMMHAASMSWNVTTDLQVTLTRKG